MRSAANDGSEPKVTALAVAVFAVAERARLLRPAHIGRSTLGQDAAAQFFTGDIRYICNIPGQPEVSKTENLFRCRHSHLQEASCRRAVEQSHLLPRPNCIDTRNALMNHSGSDFDSC